MFTTPVTRPLRWAIPVAVLGVLAAAIWFVRPIETNFEGTVVDCRDLGLSDIVTECSDLRSRQYFISALIMLAGVFPLIVIAVRACVWSADTLHSLRDEVRQLREKLDGKS